MSDPIRLFVGTSANSEDLEAEMVLEYSARKHCSLPLDITWMRQSSHGPWSGWACGTGRTPFTHFRWSIPGVCEFKGRAIYTDVDFLFVADLAELWAQDIPDVALVRSATGKLTTSCILFDCERARRHVPPLDALRRLSDAHGTVLNYFRAHPEVLAPFDGNWDCGDLRGYELGDPRVKAIHYTRIEHQLHLKHAIPRLQREGRSHWYAGAILPHPRPELQALFDQLLDEALAAGYSLDDYRSAGFTGAARRNFTYVQR
ncbi:MAG: glycosyl transferase [Acidobacteriota bacterium]|nr:glycosyl transferase [Acidobacteriota bacterium]